MSTVEVKSSWQSIFEWILRSDKLNKYITKYLTTEVNFNPLYELYLHEYEKDTKKYKKGKRIHTEEERRSSGNSEISFGSPQQRPKSIEEFKKYLYITIGRYEKIQKYVLNELHKIKDENGFNILHIMASINSVDVHPFMVLDKYHGKSLWLQTNNNHEIPLHLLLQHIEIAPLVFRFVFDNSIEGLGIQNKYGNNILHIFFSKYSNQDFQKYVIDKYKADEIPPIYLNTPNNVGETPVTIYNKNVKWYINNEIRRLKSPPPFQRFNFEQQLTHTVPQSTPKYRQAIYENTASLAELLVGIKETVKRARTMATKSSSSDDSQKQKSKKLKDDKK